MTSKKKTSLVPTIYDVAEEAGLSIATVSRVLNGKPNVTEDARRRVSQAIKALRFKPNAIARGLGGGRSRVLELFIHVADFPVDFNSDWFPGMVNGTGQTAKKHGYGILINAVEGLPDPKEIHQRIFANNVDGILMVAPNLPQASVARILDQQIPIVLVEYRLEGASYVDMDTAGSMDKVVGHLADLGHRKIACLAGPADTNHNARERLEGFRAAMGRRGLEIPTSYVLTCEFYSQELGAKGMNRLLALSDRPTAVFAANDLMAMGAWQAATGKGLRMGKDLSLVGYDDIPPVSQPPYALTTIHQDFYAMAVKASEMLIRHMEDPSAKPRQILLPARLIARESTGKPPR
jgi:LacI family transcriptional regulator